VTPDPYADAWQRVAHAVLGTAGELSEDERRAIAAGGGSPSPLLDKVRMHAYKVVDADVAGLSDDAALEAILAAALGAADERRRAALEAIG
jgi:1,6-anhydro-N-acetylmuramate kinase